LADVGLDVNLNGRKNLTRKWETLYKNSRLYQRNLFLHFLLTTGSVMGLN